MESGRLRHRVDIEVGVPVQDGSGDPVLTWEPVATVWASVSPIRGREATFAGEQVLGETDTRIIVRYGPATEQITPNHRIVHQGAIFNVVQVAHVNLGQRTIEIMAKSGVNDG